MTLVVSAHKHTKTCFDCKKDVSSSCASKTGKGITSANPVSRINVGKNTIRMYTKSKNAVNAAWMWPNNGVSNIPAGNTIARIVLSRKSQMPEMDYIPGPDETLSGRKHVRQWAV